MLLSPTVAVAVLVILLSLSSNVYCFNNDCKSISGAQLVEILQAKGVITIDVAGVKRRQVCNPVLPAIITDPPRVTITNVKRPLGAIADVNSVYVAARDDKIVYQFDHDGNEIRNFPFASTGKPRFLELHDNKLYVTTGTPERLVVSSNICVQNETANDQPITFTTVLNFTFTPNAIRFTADGQQFLIGSQKIGKFFVYNSKNLTLEREVQLDDKSHSRNIRFDHDGNVYVSTSTKVIEVFSKDYEFVRNIIYSSASSADGFVLQCDGSKILADHSGKLLFVSATDTVIETFETGVNLRNVAITKNNGLFVTDFGKNQIYVYN